jgi:two-component system, sensor histidine kinase
MDIKLAGQIDGIDAAEQIHSYRKTPIIYITGNSNLKTEKRLLATQPFEVLIKPVPDYKLFENMERALSN